jgi:Tol biopolymer transport system component
MLVKTPRDDRSRVTPIEEGTRLGPYEITAPLGAGGMGEVYRARDTRLGRAVAVKVLPQHTQSSHEDRARFRREAKTISSLNHPHICVLHDIGQEGDTDFLVMELVEGETLAKRLAQGPLPSAEVLKYGAQIADALDRAHRAGVIHRDLKPGNVMLTKSGAKLMDFGLARMSGHGARAPVGELTATAPAGSAKSDEPITAKGTVVGTFQYMAPEQLEGKDADTRSDIWALGCVLYEMATGTRAFEGSTPASVISAIMRDQPREMSELAPLAPPAFERAVRQCLAKDPDDRWQSAGDLQRELLWIAEAGSRAGVLAPVAPRRGGRERMAWALAAVAVIGLAAALILQPRRFPKMVAFELPAPPQVKVIDLPRISPDGAMLAFNATDSSDVSSLWVRPMNSLEARRLPGTEGAGRPFWSPDSRNLAYFAGSKLWKIAIGGGSPVGLCSVESGGDGTWSHGSSILFDGTSSDSIRMVSASGGSVKGAVRLDRAAGETSASWPQFLPDGRHFLYIAYGQMPDSGMLKVGSLDSKNVKSLGPAPSRVEYAAGYLLFVSGGTLIGRPFDPNALKFTGEPVALAQDVEADPGGGARFSVSAEGTLVFHSGARPPERRLVWLDRRGQRLGTVGDPGYYDLPALSPDDKQLAVRLSDWSGVHGDLWLWDLSRNLGSRFTFTSEIVPAPAWSPDGVMRAPAWSPDGGRIAYSRENGASWDIFVKSTGGAAVESVLYRSNETKVVWDWSADGAWITYMEYPVVVRDNVNIDIYALALGRPVQAVPVVTSRFADKHPVFSPDGRWLVYDSNETGRYEIYVQPFRGQGPRWRVSTEGGTRPLWRRDGREIFYIGPDRGLMSVTVTPGIAPRFGLPQKLFDSPGPRVDYCPTRDGQRFLFVVPEGKREPGLTTVVLNWPALVKK